MTVAVERGATAAGAAFAAEVAEYLQRQPRQLPSKYLYDALGAALFEAICRLPWYRITRAESALLAQHARDIFAGVQQPLVLAELGCGSGDKLALLLEHGNPACGEVHLIDMSVEALDRARDRLRTARLDALHTHALGYEEGFRRCVAMRRAGMSLMVLFLGAAWPAVRTLGD